MKTILITGASGGIGKALVEKLSDHNLILTENAPNIETTHQFIPCDLTKDHEINNLIEKLQDTTLDILFNVAGIGIYKNLEDISIEDWEKTFTINVTAPLKLIKGLLPNLSRSENPRVINIGSGSGTVGMKGRLAYVSSKFALRGLSLSLSEEYRGRINFALITLGSTLTKFGPLSIKEKEDLSKKGKAYFTVEWVANKLVEIIGSQNIEDEYVFLPE